MSQIQSKHSHRTPHAQRIDRSITARRVYTGRDRAGKAKWMKHPNQVDMRNVDTAVARKKYEARKSKESMKKQRKELSKANKKIKKLEAKKKQPVEPKQPETKTPEKFMTYREYRQKCKELGEEIKEANQAQGFAYDNMGYVDTANIEKEKRLANELDQLQNKAEAYSKKHPDWIDGVGDKKRLQEAQAEARKALEESREQEEKRKPIVDKYEKELHEAYKKRDETKQKLRDTEEYHIRTKGQLRELHKTRHFSPDFIKQVQKLDTKQQENLIKDVDEWSKNSKYSHSHTPEETARFEAINKKYGVKNCNGAYVMLTGRYPKSPKHASSSYQRMPKSDSPTRKELDNTVKLDTIRKKLQALESKHAKLETTEYEIKSNREWSQSYKTGDKKDLKLAKKYGDEADHKETQLIKQKRDYNKYKENLNKDIHKLKQDPNVKIEKTKQETQTDFKLIYKGNYVTATKTVQDVDNESLKGVDI